MSPTLATVEVAVGRTAMSMRELRRAGLLARVAARTLTLKAAAELMDVSYRQAKRLYGSLSRRRGEGTEAPTPAGGRIGR
jgi:molybdenum-dependent DNA-binding transcriptional regulator ModE